MKDGVKAAKVSKKVAYGTKETKSVAKAAESIEKGAARATKVEQVTKLKTRQGRIGNKGGAGKVVTKDRTSKLNNSQQKAIRSLKKQVAEHRQKLENYIADPDKYDHRGFLKNKPALERERLIQERMDSLKHQIDTFEKNIDAIKNGLK